MGAALFVLSSCDDDKTYIVGADSTKFGVNPVAIPVEADGGSFMLKVNGTGEWTAKLVDFNTNSTDWCTLSQMTGTGAQEVTVTINPTTSLTKMRSVFIEVTSGDKTVKSRVLQQTMVLGENEVLIDGLIWSTVNLDTPGTFVASPDEVGKLYQFNRNIPYDFDGGVPSNWPSTYVSDGTDWTTDNDPCPEGWRIPTTAEMVALWTKGATWVSKSQTGFNRNGIVIGVDAATAAMVTKDNIKTLGALFLPQSGWRTGTGELDRTWLVAVRSATSLNADYGGMSLGDSGGYRDLWGWGDGQKERAAMIRPVKIVQVEE
jgi:hypothetical protein